eukprot:536087-Rhodomonas_salina.2
MPTRTAKRDREPTGRMIAEASRRAQGACSERESSSPDHTSRAQHTAKSTQSKHPKAWPHLRESALCLSREGSLIWSAGAGGPVLMRRPPRGEAKEPETEAPS